MLPLSEKSDSDDGLPGEGVLIGVEVEKHLTY